MKIFISADIEGCAGVALGPECHKNEPVYKAFARQTTREVIAACEAAHEMGAEEIVVKDGHGDAGNIDSHEMPSYVTLIRGKSGHPYNMMWGIDESFDGVMYIGYHSPAGNPNFNISHTSTGNSLYIRLNGKYMSEFMLNSYTAANHQVPILFIAGDEEICRLAGEMVPGIETAVTKRGVGGATICVPRETVEERIRAGVKRALQKDLKQNLIPVPDQYTYEVTFKDWNRAYRMNFYPGMTQIDTFTDRLVTNQWMDIVTAHCFVVY